MYIWHGLTRDPAPFFMILLSLTFLWLSFMENKKLSQSSKNFSKILIEKKPHISWTCTVQTCIVSRVNYTKKKKNSQRKCSELGDNWRGRWKSSFGTSSEEKCVKGTPSHGGKSMWQSGKEWWCSDKIKCGMFEGQKKASLESSEGDCSWEGSLAEVDCSRELVHGKPLESWKLYSNIIWFILWEIYSNFSVGKDT